MKRLILMAMTVVAVVGIGLMDARAGDQVQNGKAIVAKEIKTNGAGVQAITQKIQAFQLDVNRSVLGIDANMVSLKIESLDALGHHMQALRDVVPDLKKSPQKAASFAKNSWKTANFTAANLAGYYIKEVNTVVYPYIAGSKMPDNPTPLQQKLIAAIANGGFDGLTDQVMALIATDRIAEQKQLVTINRKALEFENQVAQLKKQR